MSAEIVAQAIIAAVSTGAVTGASDATKKAIGDAYLGLKSLIASKFGLESDSVAAIEKLEAKSESNGRKRMVCEELLAAAADSDLELTSAANTLLELVLKLPSDENSHQNSIGTGIAQADRGSTATATITIYPRRRD